MNGILKILVDGKDVAVVRADQVPCEITPDVPVTGAALVEFVDAAGTSHRHALPDGPAWLHLSVRVHASLGCQADAVVTAAPTHAAGAPLGDEDIGVRFQPFFLAGAPSVPDLTGQGLFARGLHFSGTITPGNILLGCECDVCHRSLLVRSFHAGFSNRAYFYSASGRYTLTIDSQADGAPAALSQPDASALRRLEARLPRAPDGTGFTYLNPFRCPHCSAPYIDFPTHPQIRPSEYYGLYFPDVPPIHVDPDQLGDGARPDRALGEQV
ncbi:hypothetical protein [Sphingomonas sp.]|uniref:hypothetical protein n=1 Tax=Sphingomonas sp. TaxID=28214 RepID=UPI003B3A5D19